MMLDFKRKIQLAIGSNNRQSQGNRGKAKNGGKVFQNAGDVIEGIPPEDLEKWFVELKNQIKIDNAKVQTAIEKTIENVLVSKVAKIVVEAYKEHCENNPPDEKLVLSLEHIKDKANDITEDIQNIITSLQDTNNAVKQIKSELNEQQEQIKLQIKDISRTCEDILYSVRLAYKQCKDNKIGIKANGELIQEVKDLISNYIRAAELSNKQILSAIQISSDEKSEEVLPTHLDMVKIAEMFTAIEEIKKRMDNNREKLETIVKEYNDTLLEQIQNMSDNLADIKNKANDILIAVVSIARKFSDLEGALAQSEMNVRADIQKLEQNLEDFKQELRDLKSNESDDPKTTEEIKKYEDTIKELLKRIKEEKDKLMKIMSKGAQSNMACPYCEYKPLEARMVVDGYCRCEICGKQFIDLNPDMSKISDEKVKEDLRVSLNKETMKTAEIKQTEEAGGWKGRHTAMLENVSESVYRGLYRMKLDKYTVSSNGVLIIPNQTHTGDPITEIAFCQPNTDDKESQERLSQVKTLFLSEGIKVGEYDGKKPFSESEIKGLERVMTWDDNGYKVNEELSPKKKEGII